MAHPGSSKGAYNEPCITATLKIFVPTYPAVEDMTNISVSSKITFPTLSAASNNALREVNATADRAKRAADTAMKEPDLLMGKYASLFLRLFWF